jgi:hypothetical protein
MVTVGARERATDPPPRRWSRLGPALIDARAVPESGATAVFTTGIADREAGLAPIGADYGRVRLECFEGAIEAVVQRQAADRKRDGGALSCFFTMGRNGGSR